MDHIIPKSITGLDLKTILGRDYTCPFCLVESTNNEIDIKWIETPLIKKTPKYICLGCGIDIYSTCISKEFNDHPYKDVVEDAAKKAGIDLLLFRKICLEHQKIIGLKRVKVKDEKAYTQLLDIIDKLLDDTLSFHS